MTHTKYHQSSNVISQEKIDKLTKKIAKSLCLDDEVASALIYQEWDRIECLFEKYKKVKTVHQHLLSEIEGEYRGFICKD